MLVCRILKLDLQFIHLMHRIAILDQRFSHGTRMNDQSQYPLRVTHIPGVGKFDWSSLRHSEIRNESELWHVRLQIRSCSSTTPSETGSEAVSGSVLALSRLRNFRS